MKCIWCDKNQAGESTKDCYWVMPDGKRAVQILQIPAISCPNCGLYLSDEINQKVEDHLYIGDFSRFSDTFTYEELLDAPKIKLFQWK